MCNCMRFFCCCVIRFQAAKEAKQALLQAQQLQQYNNGLLAAGIADESGYYIEPQSNGNGGGKFKRERDDTASLVRRVMGKRTPAQDQVQSIAVSGWCCFVWLVVIS